MQVPWGRGWGAYIRRSDLTEGFLRYEFGRGGGAYIWRGLFPEFYGILIVMSQGKLDFNEQWGKPQPWPKQMKKMNLVNLPKLVNLSN